MKRRRSRSSERNLVLACLSVRKPFGDVEAMHTLPCSNFGGVVMSLPNQSQKLLSNRATTTPNKARQFAPFGRRTPIPLRGLCARCWQR